MKELDKKIYDFFRLDEKMIDITPANPYRPNENTQVDDKVPFIAKDLDPNDIMALISRLKNFSIKREDLYNTYRYMLKDSIIGSAVEMIAEDASLVSEVTDMSYWIRSDNKKFEDYINNWLKNVIDINQNAFAYAYHLLIDGEIFLETYETHEDAKTKFVYPSNYFGIIEKPYLINDLRIYGKTVGYHVIDEANQNNNKIYNKKEFIHIMRDMGDYEEFITEFKDKNGVINKRSVKSHYGRSLLFNAIQIYNIIDLIDTSLLSQYINKTQITRLVKVEVGSANKKETANIIQEIKRSFKVSRLDLDKAYKEGSKSSTISNIYIPIRNGKSDTSIETIGGDSDIKEISGLETYLNRLFSAIRVPKEFLGLGDSGFLDSSMKKKDLRYARMVTKLQDLLCNLIREMIEYKITKTEFNGDVPEFEIDYTRTSSIEEIEAMEELNNRLGIATTLADFIGKNPHVDPDEFADYIINDLLRLEGSQQFFDKTKEFQKDPDDIENMGDDEHLSNGDKGGSDNE